MMRMHHLVKRTPAMPPMAPPLMEPELLLGVDDPLAANTGTGPGAPGAGAIGAGPMGTGASTPGCASENRGPASAPDGVGASAGSGTMVLFGKEAADSGAGAGTRTGGGRRGGGAGEGAGGASVQLPDAQFRLALRRAAGAGFWTGGHTSGIFTSTGSSSTV